MQPLCSGMLNSAKGTAVMLSIQNSIGIPRYLSRCWASMILSHSVWLEKGVVRFFLVPQKLGGLERPLTQGGVSLQQAEFQVMQYSMMLRTKREFCAMNFTKNTEASR